MNILFLTMVSIKNINSRSLYHDLMRVFIKNGHKVYIASPAEKRLHEETNIIKSDGCTILRIKVGNMQKCNLIEKGISTVLFEKQFGWAIKKYFSDVKFDLIMYSTPPITFAKVVNDIKKRDNAKTYLLLKDIFPQNAVDLGMFSKSSPIYKYFRYKEKKLYKQSDYIGCMSQANVDYVVRHNPQIKPEVVHVSPNSIETEEITLSEERKRELRLKYHIPLDATVFIYGGNLGKPQGIPFFIDCLKTQAGKNDRFFIVCGTGTEYGKLKAYVEAEQPDNVLLINGLPKEEYDVLTAACDIGLIFLDHRFTIPNFPSRLLSYMQNSMPVLACTDPNTDVGKVITDGGFGWWCESNDEEDFGKIVDKSVAAPIEDMGKRANEYLKREYSVVRSYDIIMSHIDE